MSQEFPPHYPAPQGGQPLGYPQAGGYQPPYQVKTSVAAVCSLVFGILGCVPLLTSALAIVFGIVGIKATRSSQRSGRGLAIAGLVLGLLGVLLWGIFGGGLYTLWRVTGPARAEGKQFIGNLATGNVNAASAQCTTDISSGDVQKLVDYIKPMGAVKGITCISTQAQYINGTTLAVLGGSVTFDKGSKPFAMSLVRSNGQWKIRGVQFDPSSKGFTGVKTGP